ncbi:MAG: 50S ribosomal protein L25 [Candidatus Marinimicrobia bacterium]|jgi:large subunit ribosomal protein L25|nr:50S ribosomal protein L25 [Candidatus Neomarinimicrobiota bacterium]|tara:strand:- start:514 stop:1221 length:708 start_codon:yes stop_codon:yes gene_type:complete
MANEHKIDINKRESLGKKGVKQLRREGMIPGIYYSPNSENSTPIVISQGDFHEAVKSGARIFNISVGEKKQNVLFKSVQYHPVTDQVLHIDLYGIRMDRAVNIKIPVHLIGDPIGVTEEGGVISQATTEIEIACLPGDIPEFVETDVSGLAIGDAINVGILQLDEKITLITPEDTVLASVTHAMKEIEPVVEEEEEEFMDEEGEAPAEGEGEGEGGDKKPAEGGDASKEQDAGSE